MTELLDELPLRCTAADVAGALRWMSSGILELHASAAWRPSPVVEAITLWALPGWTVSLEMADAPLAVLHAAAPDGRTWAAGCEVLDWTDPASPRAEPLDLLTWEEHLQLADAVTSAVVPVFEGWAPLWVPQIADTKKPPARRRRAKV